VTNLPGGRKKGNDNFRKKRKNPVRISVIKSGQGYGLKNF